MATVAMSHSHMASPRDEHTMDTRTPSPRPPPESSGNDNDEYQPDLSQEVSLLSTKLINAINYQTNLDDSLQHTRHELEAANRENARLKAEKKSYDDMVANGMLMRKSVVDKTVGGLRVELARERAAREEAEKARKQTDAELENLTTALFEEANTMVAAARRDTEAAEKRNSQLRGQISDTELLLASQQEQLHDLKLTMERMSERGDNDTTTGRDSIPSTPIGSTAAMFDAMQLSPNSTNLADIPPEHPLYFSQLLTPVLRNDIPAYIDFQDLLQSARKAMSHSRAPSSGNSTSGLSSASQPNLASTSSPSLPGAFSFSTNSSPQAANFASTAPPLKDTKFYKRALAEDIEPTLRLDLAPGLSFLSRRTVLSSLLQGSMVVEPFLPQTKFYGPIFACALCGESRKADLYVRKHRFRTSEEESAQRYPLCDYCLGRTRAAGDFVGFLRMVRDGHWRAENEDERKGAWEEAVRLRERMFWARQGGGVVPSLAKQGTPSTANVKSARHSLESIPEQQSPAKRASHAVQAAQADGDDSETRTVNDVSVPREAVAKPEPVEKLMDVVKRHRKSMSVSGSLAEAPANPGAVDVLPDVPEPREILPEPREILPEPVSGKEVEVQAPVAHEPEVAAEDVTIIAPEPVVSGPEVQEESPVVVAEEATVNAPEPVASIPETEQTAPTAPTEEAAYVAPVPEPTVPLEQPTVIAESIEPAVVAPVPEPTVALEESTDVTGSVEEPTVVTGSAEEPAVVAPVSEPTISLEEPAVVAAVSEPAVVAPVPEPTVPLDEPTVVAASPEEPTVVAPIPEQAAPFEESTIIAAEPEPTVAVEEPTPTAPEPETTTTIVQEPTATADEPEVTETIKSPEETPATGADIVAAPVAPEPIVEASNEAAPEPTATVQDSAPAVNEPQAPEAPAVEEPAKVIAPKVEAPPTLQAPAQPTERRGSSVLARVRAMESPKPPGSFD